MNRKPIPHELIGQIHDKIQTKVYNHKENCPENTLRGQLCPQPNCHYGSCYFKLQITCENKPQIKQIHAYQSSLVKEQIWKDITEANYYGQKYLFTCRKWMALYILTDWKLLAQEKEPKHA